jgi:hypothetical protein
MFEHSKQASPISEGLAEIQIIIHLAREITWHTTHMSHEGTTSGHT